MEFQWMASTTPVGLQEMQRERSKSLLGLRMSNPGSVFWGITVRVQATKTDRQRKNSSGEVQEGQAPHLHLSSHFQIPNSVWVACEGQREIPVTMAEPQRQHIPLNPGVHSWPRVKPKSTKRYGQLQGVCLSSSLSSPSRPLQYQFINRLDKRSRV